MTPATIAWPVLCSLLAGTTLAGLPGALSSVRSIVATKGLEVLAFAAPSGAAAVGPDGAKVAMLAVSPARERPLPSAPENHRAHPFLASTGRRASLCS